VQWHNANNWTEWRQSSVCEMLTNDIQTDEQTHTHTHTHSHWAQQVGHIKHRTSSDQTWVLVFVSESTPPPVAADNMLRHSLSSEAVPWSPPSIPPSCTTICTRVQKNPGFVNKAQPTVFWGFIGFGLHWVFWIFLFERAVGKLVGWFTCSWLAKLSFRLASSLDYLKIRKFITYWSLAAVNIKKSFNYYWHNKLKLNLV